MRMHLQWQMSRRISSMATFFTQCVPNGTWGKTDTGETIACFSLLTLTERRPKSHCLYIWTDAASILPALSKISSCNSCHFAESTGLWQTRDSSEWICYTKSLSTVIFTLEHDPVSFHWTDIFFKTHKTLRFSNKLVKKFNIYGNS